MTDLSGEWDLRDETGTWEIPIRLPGDGVTALREANAIPDPYWGRNEYDLRWIAGRDWTARRRVNLDDTDQTLVVSGLDTVAEIAINGRTVLTAANAFRTWRVDLSEVALPGDNEIAIVFRSATRAADALQAAQPFYVPWHQGNCPIANGNMLRKPQCDFGWDWNIALAPFGVTDAIRLERNGPRIAALQVAQDHGDGVTLHVYAKVAGGDGETLQLSCAGVAADAVIRDGQANITLSLGNQDLWWPAGSGAQALHELTATLAGRTETRWIGLRRMELISAPDAAGRSFGIRVNGRDVYCRGANWIPADALAGRITRDRVRDLLMSARDANMNMIRVWGGGRYEPDWFYDMCDEMGLMVWQDAMFACNLYPSTDEFLAGVDAEVRETVARLQYHACLALWCGDNELVGALNWYPESLKDRDRYLASYDRLNRAVETAVKAADPGANWWPSSPSPGPLAFGDAWHDDTSGDMHFWSVWHEGRDFDHYRDVSPRFCSEFGFQSYPSMPVIRSFAGAEDLNIAAPVLESHQKDAGGNARIAETMFRYFRFPEGFANFVYLSQVQQALAIRTAVEHWRGLKPHCQGTLYWQLNDTWPCASWSSLNHDGSWKLLHHAARRFYAPIHVIVTPREGSFELRAVNDTNASASLHIRARAVDMAGRTRTLAEARIDIPPDAAVVALSVETASLGQDEILHYDWTGPDGGTSVEHFAPRPYKAYDLADAHVTTDITADGADWRITLGTDALALFVALEPDQPGRLSDNAIALLPEEPRAIIFTPAEPGGEPPGITVTHLRSATYARTGQA